MLYFWAIFLPNPTDCVWTEFPLLYIISSSFLSLLPGLSSSIHLSLFTSLPFFLSFLPFLPLFFSFLFLNLFFRFWVTSGSTQSLILLYTQGLVPSVLRWLYGVLELNLGWPRIRQALYLLNHFSGLTSFLMTDILTVIQWYDIAEWFAFPTSLKCLLWKIGLLFSCVREILYIIWIWISCQVICKTFYLTGWLFVLINLK